MFRRLARLSIALSLSFGAIASAVHAEGFAQAPADVERVERVVGAPLPVDDQPNDQPDVQPGLERALRRPTPRLSDEARARLKKVLASHRAKNVAAFRAYARRGVYPHNYINNGALNVWIDNDGHMCAAATMIFKSGAKRLVRQTAKDNNYIHLADVTDGALMDWILTSGLTHAEVIAIQAPMVGMPNDRGDDYVPGLQDWRIAEDARLRAGYDETLKQLAANKDGSLDAAVDALAWRPDLVAKLIG
jgi:hypothetical protein